MKTKIITTDIYFAAALLSLGNEIESINRDNPSHMEFTISYRAQTFSSPNLPSPEKIDTVSISGMESIENAWANGKLMVNAVDYKNALQRMKSVIHSR